MSGDGSVVFSDDSNDLFRFKTGNAGRKANSIEENQVQTARPWRQAAVNNAEAEVTKIIEDTISQEVDKA